jgi:predicted TIM-barrel fold metal-dependent hydrolase
VEIVDSQVHIWERDHPGRPWTSPDLDDEGRAQLDRYRETFRAREMTSTRMLEMMDEVGVSAAIVVLAPILYDFDSEYAFEAAAAHPDRFAVVNHLDLTRADAAELVRGWRDRPGGLGFKLGNGAQTGDELEHLVGLRSSGSAFRAAADAGTSIDVGPFPGVASVVARAHPDVQVVVGRLGMNPAGDPTWSRMPEMLALAELPNVAVKATAVPVHSTGKFPFRDTWPHLLEIIEAFGVERIMWGSDWTTLRNATYREGVDYLAEIPGLTSDEKTMILGANLRRIYQWPSRHTGTT